MDLFEQKLMVDRIPLNTTGCFMDAPDFSKGPNMQVALEWVTSLFLRVKKNDNKEIYTHVTTATDPKNMRAVFDTCKNIILKRNLSSSGFFVDQN